MSLDKDLQVHYDGHCDPACIVQGSNYRFSVLTAEMLRMEYSPDGIFEDRPTQVVVNRKFPVPQFSVIDVEGRLEISTSAFHLVYNKKEFSPNNLSIELKYGYSNSGGRWLFGETTYGNPPREHNLRGTARTLDRCDGALELEYGLVDHSGRTFFDDSSSLTINEEGWPEERRQGIKDFYYLAYGREYYKAIHDFYKLSGAVPLLPRYALGNWWSRYWPYSEKSYLELLNRFEQEGVPFSVGVLDMDWHIVDVPQKYGRGWTGYTWNKQLFPDPERFLKHAHEKGYRITLNLHPADGVMPFEDHYKEMCKALGRDCNDDEPIFFDVTNKEFLSAYFKYLHHPHEQAGVDFWWMDWQQGKYTPILGLDPLRMLNHFHFLDKQRGKEKRGLLLSRYGGLGSHRYPVGFSGDTIITWESLDFQPYFTSTASNIGYTWWSHDIGGHMDGIKDNELFIRWAQFGTFSPINRFHSTNNELITKEPWTYTEPYRSIYDNFLRLRHQLVPYIYTMNWRVHNDLIPFILPMYYDYPHEQKAYDMKNQYMFGSQLMVCPITRHTDFNATTAEVAAWIPPGNWIDFFDGTVYHGREKGRLLKLNRTIDKYPVFARAGGIVPMNHIAENELVKNPEELDIVLFAGADGSFSLYEDAGEGFGYENGESVLSEINWKWNDKSSCTITPKGDFSVLPENRTYRLIVRGVSKGISVSDANVAVVSESYDGETHSYEVCCKAVTSSKAITVNFNGCALYNGEDTREIVTVLLNHMQIENLKKIEILATVEASVPADSKDCSLSAIEIPEEARNAIIEIVSR